MAAHGIESLEVRRLRRCDNFIKKAVANPRFHRRWFPAQPEITQQLRIRRDVAETVASTQRRFMSPLAFLKRRANELGITVFRE